MNMIARWNCFSGKPHIVRSFFMRSMAILRRQKTFHEFEEVNILILAMSPYQNFNSVTMRARNSLTPLIQDDTDTLTMSINESTKSVNIY